MSKPRGASGRCITTGCRLTPREHLLLRRMAAQDDLYVTELWRTLLRQEAARRGLSIPEEGTTREQRMALRGRKKGFQG